jgi:hypothetical protein
MSGTSLDGVDGAVCVTDGSKIIDFQKTFFRPYTSNEQKALRSKLNTWPESFNFEEEIEIIQKKEKIHLSAESLRHFGNCLIRMVVEWNDNFGDGIEQIQTNENSKVVGQDPDDKNRK